jgi:hypothetical protein
MVPCLGPALMGVLMMMRVMVMMGVVLIVGMSFRRIVGVGCWIANITGRITRVRGRRRCTEEV